MKSKKLLFGIGLLSIVAVFVVATMVSGNTERKYNPKKSVFYQEFAGAYKWLASIRNNQVTGEISMADIMKARKEISELSNTKSIGLQWVDAGPDNVGGRTRGILIDKDNSNLIFAGGVAGGLFKSTTGGTSWVPVPGMPEVNICCIAQNPISGYYYIGTGESFANVDGISGTPGFVGSGLYESTDGGETWHQYPNAYPTTQNSSSADWAFVNDIAMDPVNGRMYAATNKGLKYCDLGSTTWVNPLYLTQTLLNTSSANCVEVASDRSVVVAIGNKVWISQGGTGNGEPHSFNEISPVAGAGRTEIAIAPSDPNTIYTCIATAAGALKGIYRTTDKGEHWTLIGPGGSTSFFLFGNDESNPTYGQGGYDNVIAVNPVNANQVFVGGIRVWEWHLGSQFTQITLGLEEYDVHVDMHALVFDKRNPGTFYLGSDGGVAKTTNNGQTFQTINKNYNVTQFYSVAMDGSTGIMSGTQDNSNPYVSGTGLYPKKARVLYGGDGGWSAFSFINPDVFFGTSQYAGLWRSPDRGVTYQEASKSEFMSRTMIGSTTPGQDGAGPFITPMLHWESFNNTFSADQTWYIDTLDHAVGDHITVKSQNNRYPFDYVITPADGNLSAGDTLWVQDIVSSHFFVGTVSGIWYTRGALNFGETPQWYNIANISNPHTLSISKDGNYLFVGTTSGALYRISNILAISDSLSGWYNSPYCVVERTLIHSFGQAVTSVAIDPNNPQRLLVTLGNYGNANYVYYCENALDFAPAFVSKQGTTNGKKLPLMPVYSAIFEMNHPNMVIIGTEYGIFATQDITKTASLIEWTEENDGMAKVPVFAIRQQVYNYPGVSNYGAIYIGTHGKGFFKNSQYLGINDNQQAAENAAGSLNIYPNPAIDHVNISYSLPTKSAVTIKIYDLNGKLVKLSNLGAKASGNQMENIDCSNFGKGTYIVQLLAGNSSKSAKFIVTK